VFAVLDTDGAQPRAELTLSQVLDFAGGTPC